METAHLPEIWHDLYVMLGTSSAALIGLLFVATSLHLDEIVNNPGYRIRSRNVTLHLIATLVQAAAILTPQPLAVLGVELVVINMCGSLLPLTFTYKAFLKNRQMGQRGGFSIKRAMTYLAVYLLGIAGGASLIGQATWGIYLVTFAYVGFLVSTVLDAWILMQGVGTTEAAGKPRSAARQ